MEISLNTRVETANLFLDTIRPLNHATVPDMHFYMLEIPASTMVKKAARMEGFARVLWGLGPLWQVEQKILPRR